MSRPRPSDQTIKRLYGLSGNVCAFRGCNNQLIGKEDEEMYDWVKWHIFMLIVILVQELIPI